MATFVGLILIVVLAEKLCHSICCRTPGTTAHFLTHGYDKKIGAYGRDCHKCGTYVSGSEWMYVINSSAGYQCNFCGQCFGEYSLSELMDGKGAGE